MRTALVCLLLSAASAASAQSKPARLASPTYQVAQVSRPITAVNYGSAEPVRIDFSGTWLLPKAHGQATVTSQGQAVHIEAEVDGLCSAARWGPAYLTYVLWAVGVDGQFRNLGEVRLTGAKGHVAATTDLEAFAMIITAEPYFAVTEPSNAVILRNTLGNAGLQYRFDPGLLPLLVDNKTPFDLLQARNAVRIARHLGAEHLAPAALDRAADLLRQAELGYRRDDLPATISSAREAIKAAEEARVITAQRRRESSSPSVQAENR
jgi:hypothetical protein